MNPAEKLDSYSQGAGSFELHNYTTQLTYLSSQVLQYDSSANLWAPCHWTRRYQSPASPVRIGWKPLTSSEHWRWSSSGAHLPAVLAENNPAKNNPAKNKQKKKVSSSCRVRICSPILVWGFKRKDKAAIKAGGTSLWTMENGWTAPSGCGKLLVILRCTEQVHPMFTRIPSASYALCNIVQFRPLLLSFPG